MEGGGPGALGRNTWVKQLREEDGDLVDPSPNGPRTREINMGGKATMWMGKGDRFLIETPGGGAWGTPEDPEQSQLGIADSVNVEANTAQRREWEPRGSFADRASKQAEF
jgi:5-oxoprolinase (ATP-hydrolysing)